MNSELSPPAARAATSSLLAAFAPVRNAHYDDLDATDELRADLEATLKRLRRT